MSLVLVSAVCKLPETHSIGRAFAREPCAVTFVQPVSCISWHTTCLLPDGVEREDILYKSEKPIEFHSSIETQNGGKGTSTPSRKFMQKSHLCIYIIITSPLRITVVVASPLLTTHQSGHIVDRPIDKKTAR